jgi:hypothetical protein
MEHISDYDLERYHLDMLKDEAELAPLEEHLLACPKYAERAEESAGYVDAIRAATPKVKNVTNTRSEAAKQIQ